MVDFESRFSKLERDLKAAVEQLTPRLAKVVSLYEDTVGIVFYDFTAGVWADDDLEVLAYKTFKCQRTPYDGETVNWENGQVVSYVYTSNYERTASADGEDDEYQILVPNYHLGEIVLVQRIMPLDPPGEGYIPVLWQIIQDERAWSEVYEAPV